MVAVAVAVIAAVAAPVHAESHGSVGIGPALLFTGASGDALRWTVAGELLGEGRWGGGVAWHAIGGADRAGVVAVRLSTQAAASPPKLWLRLHVEAGLALEARDPMAGTGLSVAVRLWRAVALVVDSNAHLVFDGVDGTRLTISTAMLAAIAW
jgi:hypothetical protein